MMRRPRDGEDIEHLRWLKLVVCGLLGAVCAVVLWVDIHRPAESTRALYFGRDADPEWFDKIAIDSGCPKVVVQKGDEVRPALRAFKRCLDERGTLPRPPQLSATFAAAAWVLCRRGILRPGVRALNTHATDEGSGYGYSVTPAGREWIATAPTPDYIPIEGEVALLVLILLEGLVAVLVSALHSSRSRYRTASRQVTHCHQSRRRSR